MFFFNFAPPLVAGLRISPVGAGQIGADGVHVVPIDLGALAGEGLDQRRQSIVAGFEITEQ